MNRRGERRRVEKLFQGFVGDRRPCLTAVNSFYVFGVTQTTLGGLLLANSDGKFH